MLKGVIFDMDGLLVNSEELTFKLCQKYLKEIGLEMTREFYVSLVGRTYQTSHQLFIDQYGEDFDHPLLNSEINKMLTSCYKKGEIDVKPGVVKLLEYLKENNIKTIVATSSTRDTATACLTGSDLIQYFDDMICGDEITKGKPNPEVFIKAAMKIDCQNDEVIVFEDSEAGIRAASSANMKVICIPDMKMPSDEIQELTYKILDTIDLAIPLLDIK